ncbi:uncharacterized protein TM35_000142600 [Trypanosoma theileri]|uniref:Calcineurin-like phosphoesterase domain-containing protein n=1 Tax=Trypanosoma theileri TaxID=67003 RepID=A0A1X0NXV0_9TRYP|nr:uncharacterized protein TM35_000142600 [Trypanosoma theileri]ORC89049.1 hypothetical protein TM35_000142600 [Trypanosoma theileri]
MQLLGPDVKWTIGYVIFFSWMYLFHAPFRVHANSRTDWYAQVTKVLQTWFGVVVLFFHAGPIFLQTRRTNAQGSSVSNDVVATVFFPTFCINTLIILYVHKRKRVWHLRLTYGSTVAILLLNALLLSLFSTVHYGYCMQLQERVWPLWVGFAVELLCPVSAKQAPFLSLIMLSILNVLFITLDYQYKKLRGFDPLRGLLWSEEFNMRKEFFNVSPTSENNGDWRKMEPTPLRISKKKQNKSMNSKERPKLSFAASSEEIKLLLSGVCPVNRPGMVPWFSTFIAGTAFQAVLGAMLNFLTFDQRGVELHITPKVFYLSFVNKLCTPSTPCDSDPSGRFLTVDTGSSDTSLVDQESDVWFDFIGDVGDGFNSTYEMARLLAQPVLVLPSKETRVKRVKRRGQAISRERHSSTVVRAPSLPPPKRRPFTPPPEVQKRAPGTTLMLDDYKPADYHYLPRASFVIIGGDLAYPNPTDETYQTRLIEPYDDALRGSKELRELMRDQQEEIVVRSKLNKDVAHICMLSASKVETLVRQRSLKSVSYSMEEVLRSVPLLFAIPGNHDWLDGLVTFKKYIEEESWIGGWFMPQKSSYFILVLPFNWYFICGDSGSTADIDSAQRNYFIDFIDRNLDEESCVILTCHEPAWIYEAMIKGKTSPMQPQLNKVIDTLGTRLRMRICGDIHNYSRHTPADALSEAPTLVVSGGGGAFLHGARNDKVISQGTEYRRSSAFPARNELTSILPRLIGFRLINWKFDVIAGFLSFGLIMSALPLTMQDKRMQGVTEVSQFAAGVIDLTLELFFFTFSKAYISLILVFFFFGVFFSAGADRRRIVFRAIYAAQWTILVVFCSTGMLAMVQGTIVYMKNKHLLLSGKGKWGSMMEVQMRNSTDAFLNHTISLIGEGHFLSSGIRKVQQAAYGSMFVETFSLLMRSLDVLENFAYLSEHVSMNKTGTFSETTDRTHIALYYLHLILIYWILVTPLISFVIGVFLFVSVHFFDFLYDAAYSSFQIEGYKHFVRFRIDKETRELHGYVITERHVPKVWERDSKHVNELTNVESKDLPPHLYRWPSRWKPVHAPERESVAEVLEHFVVKPHRVLGATKKI